MVRRGRRRANGRVRTGGSGITQPNFSLDAGVACDFGVDATVVRDREFYKDVGFYSDGTVRTQPWKGPLVMDFTNADSGVTIRRDLSGWAIQEYDADGAFASILIQHGNFAAVLPPGSDPGFGFYRVSGDWSSLTVNPDGTRTIALGRWHGREHMRCHGRLAMRRSRRTVRPGH
jgi:hypothetical protein